MSSMTAKVHPHLVPVAPQPTRNRYLAVFLSINDGIVTVHDRERRMVAFNEIAKTLRRNSEMTNGPARAGPFV
jgi:hypothetical protein